MSYCTLPMMVTDFGLLLFRQGHEGGGKSSRPATVDKKEKEPKDERSIRCAHCGQLITSKQYRLEIDGAHHHTFFNPAGIVYEIGCFSRATGCLASGPPSSEFSWFRGFEWRYLLCSGCFSHLGWLFESGSFSFYGLIWKKLIA